PPGRTRHAAVAEVRRANLRTAPLEEAPQDCRAERCDQDSPSRVTERRELAKALEQAVHHLRPEYAEVIALRYQQDLTLEDGAEITGLPAGTVKSFLHRARKDLADYLRRRGWSNKS